MKLLSNELPPPAKMKVLESLKNKQQGVAPYINRPISSCTINICHIGCFMNQYTANTLGTINSNLNCNQP